MMAIANLIFMVGEGGKVPILIGFENWFLFEINLRG